MLRQVFACLLLAAPTVMAQERGFVSRSVEVDGVSYAYQVFVPADWSADEKWPVIFYLHGGGERGNDGDRQTLRGLPPTLRDRPDFPAVVVMPQCRSRTWWGDPAMEAQAFAALEAAMKEFNGDPARLYLTGISMGGYGTWAFGYKYPKKFAAIVPICGGVTPAGSFPIPKWHPAARNPADPFKETARALVHVPVWVFHGGADRRVPVRESRMLTRALEVAGGNVRYTEYPGVDHNSWDRAYAEDDLIPWILAQKNGE